MKCPSCSAECSDQAQTCEFCGYSFIATEEPAAVISPPTPPPIAEPPPATSPPPVSPYQNVSQATRVPDSVSNHLIWAIISTAVATIVTMLTCCCIPLGLPSGIAAIVFALKVNKHFEAGDTTGALQASKTAKMWCWVTTALAIVFGILFVVSLAMNLLGYTDQNGLQELLKQIEAGR
ncbi:MAG: CD225/dispanin family protein [Arenimonas sp.]